MAESLLEKANRLNIKPEGESLLRKAERLGIKPEVKPAPSYTKIEPSFQASQGTGLGAITQNVAKTFANVPSSALSLAQTAVVQPVENLEKSVSLAKDIYKDIGFTEGTKAILAGAFDVYKSIGDAVIKHGDKKELARELAPVQSNLVKTRDELVEKIYEAKSQGKDTSKLVAGLKYANDSLQEIDNQIGTKEARTNQALDTAINAFEYPIERPADILLALYGGKGATGKDTISTIAKPITGGADTSLSGIASRYVEPLSAKAVTQTADEWARVGSDYVKSNKVLSRSEARGKDPTKFLAERGINPDTTKGVGERMAIADRIVTEDVKPFEEVLQKSLREADLSAPKVSLEEVERRALAKVRNKPNLTALEEESILADTRAEFDALKRKYGYSISREEMNVQKKAYWASKKWDATKPLKNDINAEIGRAFKDTIEESVDDVNVQELNRILGDHYDSATFLRSVDGKAGKATIGDKAKRAVVRAIATATGGAVGGTTGGVTGFILADSINTAMNSMSNPVREYFLSRLRVTNPEIYDEYVKTLNYLQKRDVIRASQPKLGGPTPLGTEKNPIITPAPTTYEASVQRGNQGNLGGKNSQSKQTSSISKNAISSNPTTQSALLQEARKYKSAEEFVSKQTKLLHGTDKKFDVFDTSKLGMNEKDVASRNAFFFTDSLDTAKSYGKNLQERYGAFKNPKVIDMEGEMLSGGSGGKDIRGIMNEAVLEAKKNGNDVVIFKNLSDRKDWGNYEVATHYAVVDTNKILTKSQLTDIWNKANKR